MKNKGLSFIETLIALVLVGLLMNALLHCYANSKQQELQFEKMVHLSLERQWIQDLLSQSIRRAGFTPCLSLQYLNLPFKAIHIEHASSLTLHRMDEHFSQVMHVLNERQIALEPGVSFHRKQKIIIAGCERAQLNQVESVSASLGALLVTLKDPLDSGLSATLYVGAWLRERWYAKAHQGLFYESEHSEVMSPSVEKIHISQQQAMYEVTLTWVGGEIQRFSVGVRGV